MSDSVDDKVVAMTFDNVEFEKRVNATLVSLDKLKQSLDFANSTRGMSDLANVGKNFNLTGMASSIDGIDAKFIALATIGVTTLATIVHAALGAGERITKALSIAPVMDGFQEFETNMNSIQTILANTSSKGTNLNQVNAALDELNTYSDQTIYNFSQMARNIGTFTAAGVDLERATSSIKGIANIAALSGSSADQASMAMYQLSQAIATGSVKLMDWNSVVNAGMGGEVFQKALFDTGKALGTLKNVPMDQTFEQWKAAGNSFRTSLSDDGNAVETVADKVAKATKESAKQVKAAEQSKVETAQQGAENIAQAEKNQVKAFERAAADVKRAEEAQAKTIEEGAKNSQDALDRVTAAQLRLKKAMEPETADNLQAATDNVRLAQLDQADVVDVVTAAERKQKQADEALAKAKLALSNATNPQQQLDASHRVKEAEANAEAASIALERARIQQHTATRSLNDAEIKLTDAKKKGTDEDQNVIDATDALAEANKAYIKAKEEEVNRNIDASNAVKEAETNAIETQKEAIDSLSKARKQAAENDAKAASRLADEIEQSADRIKTANAAAGANKPGWLTDKVLTTTLSAFTGDLNEAQLMSMGYTKEQSAEFLRLGKIAKDSATEVKTFSQLIGTVKEAIGSGWALTFRSVIGDFNQSKALFTGINNSIGKFVSDSANARNKILADWNKLGGRDVLIQGFKNGLTALADVLGPIKAAFREIFPRETGERLKQLTDEFAKFTKSLQVSEETSRNIKRTFAGLFAVVDIGWTIFKNLIGLFGTIIGSLKGAGSGVLGFTGNIGDMLVALDKSLVSGGKIHDFFVTLGKVIQVPIQFIKDLISVVVAFFKGMSDNEAVQNSLGRLQDRFDSFNGVSDRFINNWHKFAELFDGTKKVFDGILGYIKTWFSELGKKLADSIQPGDFNAALDAVNVGLLGGIVLLLTNFVKNGFKINIGDGIFKKAGKALDTLTSKLQAMQANVKADTLKKIAVAVALLTGSVLVLSLINSEALTKSMTALAVGFGELVGTMAILNKVASGPKGAATLGILVAGMIGMAGAMVILAGAVAILSLLSPEKLAQGLVGITAALTVLVGAVKLLEGDATGVIAGALAMNAMATALIILAGAVKLFSMMSWGDMAKGLVGIAAALLIVAGTMQLIPIPEILAAGLAMIPLATGLAILAGVVKLFSMLSWSEIGKGLVGLAGALLIIAGAMNLMPPWIIIIGPGLLKVAEAIVVMTGALAIMGSMKLGTLAKSLGALAAMLLILAVGLTAMILALPGAAALVVVSGALLILATVLKILGSMSIFDIVKGLGAIAATLLILGAASLILEPVIPMMFALGAALALIGGAFALFGVGAMLVAKSFEFLAQAGAAGAAALVAVIITIVTALPRIAAAFVTSLADSAASLLAAIPMLVGLLTVLLGQLLDTVVTLAPKIGAAFEVIVTVALQTIRDKFPDVVTTGLVLLLSLLKGIRDNIGQVIDLGISVLTNFIIGLGRGGLRLAAAAADTLINFLNGMAYIIKEKEPDIMGAGVNIAVALGEGFLKGLEKVPILGSVIKLGEGAIGAINKVFDSHSPSKVFERIGAFAALGLAIGFDKDTNAENSAAAHADRIVAVFSKTISTIPDSLVGVGDYTPTITPVLDLSKVQAGSRDLSKLLQVSPITPAVSFAQANLISTTSELERTTTQEPVTTGPSEVNFNQTINAPTALSTNDIYRGTRSQIALAKEELGIS